MYSLERAIGGFKRILKNRLKLRDRYVKYISQKRHQTFAPITLSFMFNLGEQGLVGITMEVKAQLSQPYLYSTSLVIMLENAKIDS